MTAGGSAKAGGMETPLNLDATANPRIEGERIYLRRLTAGDVSDAYLGWMNAPEINRYLESRFQQHSRESLLAFVASMANDPKNLFTGIFLRAGDRHIGNIKLGPIHPHHRHAEIGLIVGARDCWGQGYATEAIAILTDFAFAQVGVHKIIAGAYADNEGSARAFEKAGYVREGLMKDQWRTDDGYQDGILLGKVAPRGGGA